MKCALFSQTDVGIVRKNNEDDHCTLIYNEQAGWQEVLAHEGIDAGPWGIFLVVADGMGGANAGEVAAQTAVASVKASLSGLKEKPLLPADVCLFLKNALAEAHWAIVQKSQRQPQYKGMGTTATLAWICNGRVHLAWSGDSRAYLWVPANQQFKLLSKDHSYVQQLIDAGKLTEELAHRHPKAHIITQNLGDHATPPEPDSTHYPLHHSDRLLICSDGINTMLTDRQIRQWLASKNPLAHIGRQLIADAKNAGGFDNITVAMLEVLAISEQPQKRKSAWRLW